MPKCVFPKSSQSRGPHSYSAVANTESIGTVGEYDIGVFPLSTGGIDL